MKHYKDAAAVPEGLLFDGMTIAARGFGLCGIPELYIEAIRDSGSGNSPSSPTIVAWMTTALAGCSTAGRSGG